MARFSYRRHRFPPTIIQHAIWLYLRFTLSYRDIEDLLAQRGIEVYETVRRWVLKFGPPIVRKLGGDAEAGRGRAGLSAAPGRRHSMTTVPVVIARSAATKQSRSTEHTRGEIASLRSQ
jgi:hypothetical protein